MAQFSSLDELSSSRAARRLELDTEIQTISVYLIIQILLTFIKISFGSAPLEGHTIMQTHVMTWFGLPAGNKLVPEMIMMETYVALLPH